MHLEHLWLADFRNYAAAELEPAREGLTVVTGDNGQGKTSLLEAIGYLATLRSFRGAPPEALIRVGAERAVVRATGRREARELLVEAELQAKGRGRVQLNRQPLRRGRDLLGALRATVFTPDDLSLVKGGPQHRREYLDEMLVSLHPRHDATQTELERVLKQRNALLRSATGVGRPDPNLEPTLDVWDAKMADAGERLVAAREGLTRALLPLVAGAYAELAVAGGRGGQLPGAGIGLEYQRSWTGPLVEALTAARRDDLRRGVTTVGPQRDEVAMTIAAMPARSHGSQGEQRTLALALRLAGHHLVTDRVGTAPVLLLDDVFSELDAARASGLLAALPSGQAVLTTAGDIPAGADPALVLRVRDGRIGP
ncbi:MAG: DNA replication/repair protein RecF [Acidimicrobiales bacterium]